MAHGRHNVMVMMSPLSQAARPTNQAEFQRGRLDGERYHGEGHLELMELYEGGTPDYRMGFDASVEMSRCINPGFAS